MTTPDTYNGTPKNEQDCDMYPLKTILHQLADVYHCSVVVTPDQETVRVGKRTRTLIALAINKKHGFVCRCCFKKARYCGVHVDGSLAFYVSKGNPLTIDHKVPKVILKEQGVPNPGTKNFQILCNQCNQKKDSKL